MNQENMIAMAGFATGATSLVTALLLYRKLRRQSGLLEFVEQQVGDFDEIISRNKEQLETNAQRLAEQQRRIAWLETRVRHPRQAAEETVNDSPAEAPKMNITERRHRVIKLAGRGQNIETIAATLGMLPGEVDLIINLNQSAKAAR